MTGADWEILGVVAAGLGIVVLPIAIGTYRRFRAARSVACPASGAIAGVRVDALSAAIGSAFDRLPLKVASCSLWPAKKGCGEECVAAFREERAPAVR